MNIVRIYNKHDKFSIYQRLINFEKKNYENLYKLLKL